MRAHTGACACVRARLQLPSSPGNAPDYDCDEDEEDEAHSGSVTGMKASSVGRKMTEFKCKIRAAQNVRMMDRYGSWNWTFTASVLYNTGIT